MWLLWSLGVHEDKQEKLVEEIRKVSTNRSSISVETLQHMPYLKACVKESFRFVYPTVNGPMRIIPNDMILGDYLIPKHTWVLFGHNTLCRSPAYFDQPDKYIPERWMDATQTPDRRRKMTLSALAFGMGRRNCVGRRLAEQQIYVALIKILHRYKITIPETSRNPEISYSVAALPEKDLDIRFVERT